MRGSGKNLLAMVLQWLKMFSHITKMQMKLTLSSNASQSTEPEEEVSIWCDERELQNTSDTLANLTGGRFSPIRSTLNAAWDDISSTQRKYYMRKAQEAVTASLTVISPGQEKELWNSIRRESLIN